MYELIKEEGYGKAVTLMNTDTRSSIAIGGVSTKLLDLLKADGHETIAPHGPWRLKVSDETAKELAALALPMKKPVRKTKTKDEASEQPKDNSAIDALDVIYGLAKYNN